MPRGCRIIVAKAPVTWINCIRISAAPIVCTPRITHEVILRKRRGAIGVRCPACIEYRYGRGSQLGKVESDGAVKVDSRRADYSVKGPLARCIRVVGGDRRCIHVHRHLFRSGL